MISNSGHDESGKYRGGQAGDQTGEEWAVIPWYNRPWNVVMRHPDADVGADIAALARAAALNNKVGYNQDRRTTFWAELYKAGYDPAKIAKACDADCSSGVSAIVKAVGYRKNIVAMQKVSKDAYTGNLRAVLKAAGFTELTDKKYLTSDAYILPGDVLLYEGHHTAINLDAGEMIAQQKDYDMGWHRDDRGWWYAHGTTRGSYYKDRWAVINHHWYYFDDDGYILTGWHEINGRWYYFQPNGDLEGALWHEATDRTGAMEIWYVN